MKINQKQTIVEIVWDCQNDYTYLHEINSLQMNGGRADVPPSKLVVRILTTCLKRGRCNVFATKDGIVFELIDYYDAIIAITDDFNWMFDLSRLPRFAVLMKVDGSVAQ